MRPTRTLLLFLLCFTSFLLAAQHRYLQEIFPDEAIEAAYDVEYGINATIMLNGLPTQEAQPQPLTMDLYFPSAQMDGEPQRPLVLLVHGGNFLPFPINQSPTGTTRDSALVYLARAFARRGFVAASIDYRLGWSPLEPTQEAQFHTLLTAIYRGIQDVRTCVRFFRRNAAESGNTFGIHPEKIMMLGDGAGGVISLNTAALDEYEKLVQPAFMISTPSGNPEPIIQEAVNGDIYGASVGIANGTLPPGLPAGDTICYPNHPGYSSGLSLCVNLSGGLLDSAWVEPGQMPLISFHAPSDPLFPFKGPGQVIGPIPAVISLYGSYWAQKRAFEQGNNGLFAGLDLSGQEWDDYAVAANARNEGLDGLFPLPTSTLVESAPWHWWSPDNPNHQNGLATNPGMSREKATAYLDTVLAYVAPRTCLALELGCQLTPSVEKSAPAPALEVSPNPASFSLLLRNPEGRLIREVYLYSPEGRPVRAYPRVNASEFTLLREQLPPGMYFIQAVLEGGMISKKVVFR